MQTILLIIHNKINFYKFIFLNEHDNDFNTILIVKQMNNIFQNQNKENEKN